MARSMSLSRLDSPTGATSPGEAAGLIGGGEGGTSEFSGSETEEVTFDDMGDQVYDLMDTGMSPSRRPSVKNSTRG